MQTPKSTNPFETTSNIHNYPQPPSSHYNDKQQSKHKLQHFETEIRNNQIRDIKKGCRQELIIAQQIESPYKKYNSQTKSQFFPFLIAVAKINKRIVAEMQVQKFQYIDDSLKCNDKLYCMQMLLQAAKDLLAMNNKQILQKIQLQEKQFNYTLYAIAANIIRDLAKLLHQIQKMPQEFADALKTAIELLWHYEVCFELGNKPATNNSQQFSLKQEISYDLVYILHRSTTTPHLQNMRKLIYFQVRNNLVDTQINESIRYSLLEINDNSCHIKLLHLLKDLLSLEQTPAAFYELAYLIYSIFNIVPLSFRVEIIQGICCRIVKNLSIKNNQSRGKQMLVTSLLILMQILAHEGSPLIEKVRSIIMDQLGNSLNNILTRHTCEQKLYQAIELLIKLIKRGVP